MKPIYEPKARAKEYGDLAINIYTGCNHGCYYCFAPKVLHKSAEAFMQVEPRAGIVEAVKRQLEREHISGKLIHLCFTCDPYPAEVDTMATRKVIKAIKESGNHVQILTKGGARALRDFDLLDGEDWFGVTITGATREQEPNAASCGDTTRALFIAHLDGMKTWISFEPVINAAEIYGAIRDFAFVDKMKIGKLNYHPSDINWAEFGRECERLCKLYGRNYTIKDDLRREMEKTTEP